MSRPLKLYYGETREDNFTTVTAEGESDSLAAGYRFVRTEGYCLAEPALGTVPLKLFYSDARGDNFTTATEQGAKDAADAGYDFLRTEGYVYSSPRGDTVPLKLFYSDARGDNFTTATEQGAKDAADAGYDFIRTEGHVHPQPIGGLQVDFPLVGRHSWQQSAMHMDAEAFLTQDGQLRAEISTWCTWWLKGFTGGCLVLVVDSNENVIYNWLTWPLGVNGTKMPGRSRRADFPQMTVDADITARAARLQVACSHMPKDRWDDIIAQIKKGITDVEDLVTFIVTTTKALP